MGSFRLVFGVLFTYMGVFSASAQGSLPESLLAELPGGQVRDFVVVTLSTTCPCSASHLAHLSELARSYPQMTFIGIHADAFVKKNQANDFFKSQNLAFVVWHDQDLTWSRTLGAVTTPHAFVFQNGDQLIYRGAVSSGSQFSIKNRAYLKEALQALDKGKKPSKSVTRPRGCEINYPSINAQKLQKQRRVKGG